MITRKTLKRLLYLRPGAPPDLSSVVYRKRQKRIVPDSEEDESGEGESETDADTSESDEAPRYEAIAGPEMSRQNAVDRGSDDGPFEYVRYCEESEFDPTIDCTYEIFENITVVTDDRTEENPQQTLKIPRLLNQNSEFSDNSSFERDDTKNYMACEDLSNVDQNLAIKSSPFGDFARSAPTRRSCPTKFVANKFNDSTLTLVCVPGRDSYGSSVERRDRANLRDLELKNSDRDSPSSPVPILEPPPMFRNDRENEAEASVLSIASHLSDLKNALKFDDASAHASLMEKKNCSMCDLSQCHTPRSSDSGVAGSCNLASPEMANRDDLAYAPGETRSLRETARDIGDHLSDDYSMSTGEIDRLNLESCRLENVKMKRLEPARLSLRPSSNDDPRVRNRDERPYDAAIRGRSIPDLIGEELGRERKHNFNQDRHRPDGDFRQTVSVVAKRTRSKSQDLAKKLVTVDAGRVTYRSELYAHWWMKAKLPAIVTSSGKDAFVVVLFFFSVFVNALYRFPPQISP